MVALRHGNTAPIVNNTSLSINITNEGGYGGMTGLLKNIIGLWLIQESRRQWKREGEEYSYADLERMALSAEPFKCFIDPDSPSSRRPEIYPAACANSAAKRVSMSRRQSAR